MNTSMFSSGELPPRKCENLDTRNGVMSSVHAAAIECHQRNFRDGFHGKQMRGSSGSSHEMLPNRHDIHSEAGLYGSGHVQIAPVRLTCSCSAQHPELFHDHDHHQPPSTCSCSGQHLELFHDHDHHQPPSLKRRCHGITGSSTTNSNQIGHLHNVCDRGCCGSVAMRREWSAFTNCGVERAKTTGRNSVFVDVDFQRNAAAVGSMSHFPSSPREVETRSSSLNTGAMANSAFHTQTKAANNQIMLYGWFLMKPVRENYSMDHSTFSSVAIGGYRCPRMEEKDFVGTANVVQRLERWKLRTSDGLEFGLMGVINIEKSVANGFPPALVQCFTIGFPSAWVYMLLNLQKGVSKVSSSGLSPSSSPTNSAGTTGVIRNPIRDCRGISMASLPEENPIQSILQSSLFTAAPDPETKAAILPRFCTATTTPSQDGVSSDANSGPQVHLRHEQVDEPKDADRRFLEVDFANVASQPKEPPSSRDCSPLIPEGVAARNPREDPGTSSQAQIQKNLEGSSSNTDDIEVEDGREDPAGPSLIDNIADEVRVEVSNGVAATCDSEKDATELGSMAPDHVPCTPQLQSKERLRTDTDAPAADTSSIELVVAPESLPHIDISKLSSETTQAAINTPVTVSVADPVGTVQTRDRRKRPNSTSDSLLVDFLVVESISAPAADPSSTAETRDKRKRPRREPQSPVVDIHMGEPITVIVPDPLVTIRRKSPRSETHSPVGDVNVLKPTTGSVPDPVFTIKTRNRSKSSKSESHSPVDDIPVVERITLSVPDPVRTSKTRYRRKSRRSESRSPVDDTLAEPTTDLDYDLVGTIETRVRRKSPRRESYSPEDNIPVAEPVTSSFPEPVGKINTTGRRKSPRSQSHSCVADIPFVEPVGGPPYSFLSNECQGSPDVTDEQGYVEHEDKLVKEDTIRRDDLDVEGNQSCKDTTEVRGRARKKRYKISRNYYQRGKKKSSTKKALEKGTPRPDRSTRALKTPIEETNVTYESKVVGKKTEEVKKKVDRAPILTRRSILKFSLPPEAPESLSGTSHVKTGRQAKKSRQIVPPPLPPPRVADKSKVTEAFGLKRSLRGRVLVPPLATWRSQSIKYDTDGGIIAISDGFSGSKDERCTGYHRFEPPADKGARTMQARLCKAANRSRKA